jgi:DNA modification methylase
MWTVYHKSSADMSEIGSQTAQLIITSPPYWNIMRYSEQREQIGREQPYEDYLKELDQVWKECERILAPNGKLCINTSIIPISPKNAGKRCRKAIPTDIEKHVLSNTSLGLYDLYIWDKGYFLFGNQHLMFGSYPYPPNLICRLDYEFIYVFVKSGEPIQRTQEVKKKSELSKKEWVEFTKGVWRVSPEKDPSKGHLAPFSLEIPYRLIKMFSFWGDLVVDPFAGRGTVLKVAEFLGRNSAGYEIVKSYKKMTDSFMKSAKAEEELLEMAKKYEARIGTIAPAQRTLQ